MPVRRKVAVSDRRKVDAEFRLHLINRSDALELLIQGVQLRVDSLESTVKGSMESVENCVDAVRTLTEETVLARQIYSDGKGTARLVKLLWKPFIIFLIVGFFGNALFHFVAYGSWPEWYKVLLTLK